VKRLQAGWRLLTGACSAASPAPGPAPRFSPRAARCL